MKIINKIKRKIAENKEVFFPIKVYPGASENKISDGPEGVLYVKITTIPEDNKANRALIKFLASELELRRYQVEISKGKTTQLKTIKISR